MLRLNFLVYAIVEGCNAHCSTCDEWKNKIRLSDNWKDVINDAKKNGVRFISFFGGEPTLHPDLCKMIDYAKSIGCMVSILTNGSLRNEARIQKMANCDLIGVSITHSDLSIDDTVRGEEMHQRALHFLASCRKYKIKSFVNILLTKENIEDLEEITQYFNQLGHPVSFCFPISERLFNQQDFFFENQSTPSDSQLSDAVNHLIKMKKNKILKIVDPMYYFYDYKSFIEGYQPVSRCPAGERIFYADVSGNIFKCQIDTRKLLNENNGKEKGLKWHREKNSCERCYLQCTREIAPAFTPKRMFPMVKEILRTNNMIKRSLIEPKGIKAKSLLEFQS